MAKCQTTCVAPDYLLVHEDIKTELIKELVISMIDAIEKRRPISNFWKNLNGINSASSRLLSNVSAETTLMKEEILSSFSR